MTYRIGVDARLLTQTITGIGRYSHETLRRLIETEHEWFLYAPTSLTVGDWRRANVSVPVSYTHLEKSADTYLDLYQRILDGETLP